MGQLISQTKLHQPSLDGIEAIKLLIKGNAINNPFFQVGDDTNPSLLVDNTEQSERWYQKCISTT